MDLVDTKSSDDRAAIEKALSLLEAFGRDGHLGIGVSELARRAGLTKSTAFRILATLERHGAVERSGRAYRLGCFLYELGNRSMDSDHDSVRDLLTPHLADLYEATHYTVHLAVLQGTSVLYLNKLYGHQQLASPSRIGGRAPAYCTAVGKIQLAFAATETEQVLAEPMRAWTSNTITDSARLTSELAEARRNGVARDNAESRDGLYCFAAPVLGADGRPIAALSVSGDSRIMTSNAERVLRQVCFEASSALRRSKLSTRVA